MGPRSCDRGNLYAPFQTAQREQCFNGAAILRSRKCQLAGIPGKEIRRFNGAAILRSRKLAQVQKGGRAAAGFNGAAILRSRK